MSRSVIDNIFNESTAFERSSTYLKKMETLGRGLNSVLGKTGKNGPETQVQNGLATPGASLEPDEARNAADKARQAAETGGTEEDTLMVGENDGGDDDDDDDEDGDFKAEDDDEEANEARKRVMNCDEKNYREILGVNEAYSTRKEERTAILDEYRDLGALLHPDFSDDKDAEAAVKSKWHSSNNLDILHPANF
jgi:hypothetical protein